VLFSGSLAGHSCNEADIPIERLNVLSHDLGVTLDGFGFVTGFIAPV
jgi:hypothetical protein